MHCSGKCVHLCVVHLDKIVEATQMFFSHFKTNFDGVIFEEFDEASIGVECSGPKFIRVCLGAISGSTYSLWPIWKFKEREE